MSEALRQLCRRHSDRTGIAITCSVVEVDALDPMTEQAIYRIAEAALANVERHSAASKVALQLAGDRDTGRLRLEVSDNGTGFEPGDQANDDHYGLTGMVERADLVGAQLRVKSAPGQGTRVILET